MLGIDSDPGIMVRTLNYLFKKMELTSGESEYEVKMSYLEVICFVNALSGQELNFEWFSVLTFRYSRQREI